MENAIGEKLENGAFFFSKDVFVSKANEKTVIKNCFIIVFNISLLKQVLRLLGTPKDLVSALSFDYLAETFFSPEGKKELLEHIQVKKETKENPILVSESFDFEDQIPEFFNVFNLSSKALENSYATIDQWDTEVFAENPTEKTWLERPKNISSAVFLFWKEFFTCDLCSLSVRKQTNLIENTETFSNWIQNFALVQNTERTKLMASTKKQRTKKAVVEDSSTFLYNVRYREKDNVLLIVGTSIGKTLMVSLDFFQDQFFLVYGLRLGGPYAHFFFLQLVSKPSAIEGFIYTQYEYILQKCIPGTVVLEPIQNACNKFAFKEPLLQGDNEDKTLLLFQKSFETIEKIFVSNRSRAGLLFETTFFYFFAIFLPKVQKAGYRSLIRKAIRAMEVWVAFETQAFEEEQGEQLSIVHEKQKAFEDVFYESVNATSQLDIHSISLRGQLDFFFQKIKQQSPRSRRQIQDFIAEIDGVLRVLDQATWKEKDVVPNQSQNIETAALRLYMKLRIAADNLIKILGSLNQAENFVSVFPRLIQFDEYKTFVLVFENFLLGKDTNFESGGIPFEINLVSRRARKTKQKYNLSAADLANLFQFVSGCPEEVVTLLLEPKNMKSSPLDPFLNMFSKSLYEFFQNSRDKEEPVEAKTAWSNGVEMWNWLRVPQQTDAAGNPVFSEMQKILYSKEKSIFVEIFPPNPNIEAISRPASPAEFSTDEETD